MNTFFGDMMKVLRVLLFFLLTVFAGVYVFYYALSTYSSKPITSTFSVSGEGTVETMPDKMRFFSDIQTEEFDTREDAQKRGNTALAEMKTWLEQSGVVANDVDVTSQQIDERTNYQDATYKKCIQKQSDERMRMREEVKNDPSKNNPSVLGGNSRTQCKPPISGYVFSATLNVKVRDMTKAQEILSGMHSREVTSIYNIGYGKSDGSMAKSDALSEAFADARQKASMVASAGGFHIGRMESMTFYYVPDDDQSTWSGDEYDTYDSLDGDGDEQFFSSNFYEYYRGDYFSDSEESGISVEESTIEMKESDEENWNQFLQDFTEQGASLQKAFVTMKYEIL